MTSVQTAGNCGNTRRRRVKVDFLPYIIFSVAACESDPGPAGWGNSDRVKSGHLNQNKHLFLHGFGTVDLIEWLAGRYSESLYQRNYSLLFISALTLLLPCLPPPSLLNCRSPKAMKMKMLEDAAQASRRAAAIDAIEKKNWSVRKAAKQFGIPKTTLQDCLSASDAGRPLLP